ncbi:MAG: tRNA threonylcarbamoyladenosine biosynthesis protein TsaB [Solirubrobacteraceae bacterium]|jgi:tRNA threonylcarbamoyladenosine biosynthesis protein TsaB|nr:tRNA threonylcarbamoyladenosine biosynthesis protein TsaB [Solirubrobacteraceae bacterium]MEA2225793.1 tRNA threonylcarbamoyladenosine biosynthesis protein TsaB [Solirubrobacteraceae bacterium]
MIVLGFDTATQATVVGLRLADGGTLQARDDPAAEAHPGHATRLLSMAGELLTQAGIRWSAVERIAVGIGPGRFTGLRVGIATARGLAQSLDVGLAGVSSLQALALSASAQQPGRAVLAVIDARRGEAFAAAYPPSVDFAAGGSPAEPLRGEIEIPRAVAASHLQDIVEELERAGAPPAQRWLAVGDGAVLFARELAQAGVEVAADGTGLNAIDPLAICRLGARAALAPATAQILPDYRRTPDAALARNRPMALGGAAP